MKETILELLDGPRNAGERERTSQSDTAFLIGGSVLIAVLILFFFSLDWDLDWDRPRPLTQESICQVLALRMEYSQGKTLGSGEVSIAHPSLEGAELVREVFEKPSDTIAMCTVRMRMPDGEEDLYTYIYSTETIRLSSVDECEEMENCEVREVRENPFGPSRDHYYFVEVNRSEGEGSGG